MATRKRSMCAAVLAGGVVSAALAAPSGLRMDLNALAAQSLDASSLPAPFGGLTHTGSVALADGASSTFDDILLNGTPQGIAPGLLNSFSGSVDLGNGTILGGFLTFTLNNGDSFNASITSGFGGVAAQGSGYTISGAFFNGVFSTDPFAGVSITPYFNAQPFSGSFSMSGLNPVLLANGTGFDDAVDIQIFVIPAPPVAGTLGLAACMAARRRRG